MRVVVHQVGAHVPRPDLAEDRVHVGAVEVEQGPAVVQEVGDRLDLRVEQADGVGVGHHEDGRLVVEVGLEVLDVHQALRVALDRDRLEPREVRRGRVRPVGAVGHQDLGPLLPLVAEVGRRAEQGGQLSLRPRRRLEADGRQAGDLGEHPLHVEEDRQDPLERRLILVRMQRRDARQARQPLVPLRVVLHRARAERVEVPVDRHVQRRQVRVMPDDVQLAELRQGRRRGREVLRRDQPVQRPFGHVRRRDERRRAARAAGFEEELGRGELVHGGLGWRRRGRRA